MIALTDRVRRARLTACRYVGDSAIIMVVRRKRLYRIDGVGMRICRMAENPVSLQELCDRVAAEYEVPPERARADVLAFVRDLAAKDILTTVP